MLGGLEPGENALILSIDAEILAGKNETALAMCKIFFSLSLSLSLSLYGS
jgi:hypothetical protein